MDGRRCSVYCSVAAAVAEGQASRIDPDEMAAANLNGGSLLVDRKVTHADQE